MAPLPPFISNNKRGPIIAARPWSESGRLGLLNGLLIGLALAAGLWLIPAAALLRVPTPPVAYAGLAIGALLVVTVGALAGWLAALLQRTWASFLIWLGAAALISRLIAYQISPLPTHLQWLLEPALFGRQLYAVPAWSTASVMVSGIFIFLVLGLLALLQEYRLEDINADRGEGGWLTGAAWFRLLLPLPFVALAGGVTGNFYSGHLSPQALAIVHQGISTARTYEGDLFALQLETGVNYGALQGVREQLGEHYTLSILDVNPEMATTTVAAHFENGAWIHCRVIHNQLNFCYDGLTPYTVGFSALITGEPPPEDCNNCAVAAADEWRSWLAQRRPSFGGSPQIAFVRQRGRFVLMQAASPDAATGVNATVVECWFQGSNPVQLESCQEVSR